MKIPENPQYIQNETITLDEKVYPILRFTLLPGKHSDSKMLGFNWTFIEFKSTELLLKLDFENQNCVSSHNMYPEQIYLTIYGF
jgi:hypothetical protein